MENETLKELISYLRNREAQLHNELTEATKTLGSGHETTDYYLGKWGELSTILDEFQITPCTPEEREKIRY